MFKIFGYLKNSIPQVLLIIVLLIIQAWGDLTLPQYTSDIVDIGIQNGGIEDAAADALTVDGYNSLKVFMNDEQKSVLEKSYKLVNAGNGTDEQKNMYPASKSNDVFFLNDLDNEEKQALIDAVKSPMTAAEMLSELSFSEFSAMVEKQGITLPFTSYELAGEALGIDVDKANALTVLIALAGTGVMDNTDLSASLDKLSDMPGTITEQSAVLFIKNEYSSLGVDMNALQQSYLLTTGGKMLLIAFLMMAVSVIVGFFAATTAAKVGRDLRARVFKNVVGFSNTEIDKFSTASLITRSTNDIQQIQMVIVMLLRMVIYAPILGIGGVFMVLTTGTDMAWIIALAVIVILAVVLVLMKIAMPKFKLMQKLVDKLNLVAREILTGLPVIRAFSRERYEEGRFDKANKDLTSTMLFTNRTMTFMMPLMMMIMNLITVLIIWIGAGQISDGSLQVGDMMAFITYTMQIVMSFLMLTMISIMLPRAAVSADRINEVITAKKSIEDKPGAGTFDKSTLKGNVSFENVSFRYPDADEDVLTDISFTANAGETTAIIGSTGSGKSTLINLIPRSFDVTKGRIAIDGTDIRDVTQHSLHEVIGLVPQKGVLFSGTIDSNIKFGAENASEKTVKLAADVSQSSEFIDSKPQKYNEPVSQGGTNVSGGQKQRLSIARAIAKEPKIYLFDDSFSALDFKTDVKLRKALADNIYDCTIIIVAQRISTIINADKIVVLDEGKIAGIGTHEQLMQSCEVYRQIAHSQLSQKDLAAIDNAKGVTDNE